MWKQCIEEASLVRTALVRHRRKEIALFRLEDGIYATDNSCSHEYSPLCEGMVVEDCVYCPMHGSRFNIKTGAVLNLPATRPIRTYEVKIEDGWIFVNI